MVVSCSVASFTTYQPTAKVGSENNAKVYYTFYKLSTYLVVAITLLTYLLTYLYIGPTSYRMGYQGKTRYIKYKVTSRLNVHPQLSHNGHPLDDGPLDDSLWS